VSVGGVTWSVRDVIFVACAFATVAVAAWIFTPHHRTKCRTCDFVGSPDDLYHHKCSGSRAKQRVG
jgi:hypothetical protein